MCHKKKLINKKINNIDIISRWRVLNEKTILDASPWFKVKVQDVMLPDGKRVNGYYQIDSPSYAEIVPINKRGKVLCYWRYKHGPLRINLGFPAGYIQHQENFLDAAKRELQEESGLMSSHWDCLGSFTLDGNRGQTKAYLFIAWDCIPTERLPSDDLETAQDVWLGVNELENHLQKGDVATISAATALLLALPLIRARFKKQLHKKN
jgi:ADP-ribose pyrophosphatase